MIISVQIICIFCIMFDNNADGIFLSWIYFVRFYFAEHTNTYRHTQETSVLYSQYEGKKTIVHSFIKWNHLEYFSNTICSGRFLINHTKLTCITVYTVFVYCNLLYHDD